MLKVKNRDNLYFEGMDPWQNALSAKKLVLLQKSWAEIFRKHILPKMPIHHVAKYFDKDIGRPTKEVVSTCGVCVLQQIFDLTDAETVDQLAFNQQWHYALDVLDQDDQVVSYCCFDGDIGGNISHIDEGNAGGPVGFQEGKRSLSADDIHTGVPAHQVRASE